MKMIRHATFIALAFILVFPAGSRALPYPYIGLYVDAAHSVDRQDIPAPYMMFTAWVWTLPNDYGQRCVEFKLVKPTWLLCINRTPNPSSSVIIGVPFESEVSFCFSSCQTDWVWLYQLEMLPVSGGLPGFIEIEEYYKDGWKCPYSYICCYCGTKGIKPFRILNKLGLNQDALIGTEDSSWGAIKSIYSEH